MGTDIHAVWQAKKNEKWEDVASTWEQDRHYFLFAWLADVRNGFGFAGVPTHTAIKPLAQPRGFPPDFECVDDHPTTLEALPKWRREHLAAEERKNPVMWMGDHTPSWLSADEILAAERPTKVARSGVVSREFFDKWDHKTQPDSWSGGISGPQIVVSNENAVTEKTTHVRIYWEMPSNELDYFVDEVKRLKELHKEVRLVFGFDS